MNLKTLMAVVLSFVLFSGTSIAQDYRPKISTGLATVILSGDSGPSPAPVVECDCKGTGYIVHGDGHKTPCPCPTGQCKCASQAPTADSKECGCETCKCGVCVCSVSDTATQIAILQAEIDKMKTHHDQLVAQAKAKLELPPEPNASVQSLNRNVYVFVGEYTTTEFRQVCQNGVCRLVPYGVTKAAESPGWTKKQFGSVNTTDANVYVFDNRKPEHKKFFNHYRAYASPVGGKLPVVLVVDSRATENYKVIKSIGYDTSLNTVMKELR